MQLHKKIVYRLALYQVLAALLVTVTGILQVVHIVALNTSTDGTFCKVIGWSALYCRWMKLLFTLWVSFHLFCFVVFRKNLMKLEAMYVVTSLLVPAVIAMIPFTTDSYASKDWCYVINEDEIIILWSAPAMVALVVASIAMVFTVGKLARIVLWRAKYEELTDGDKYWKALKQLLPLAAFPVLFFIFMIPVLVFDLYFYENPSNALNTRLEAAVGVFIPMWSISSGAIVLIHIFVTRNHLRRRKCNSFAVKMDARSNELNSTV